MKIGKEFPKFVFKFNFSILFRKETNSWSDKLNIFSVIQNLIFFHFTLNVFFGRCELIPTSVLRQLHVADFRWNVIEPGEEEEQHGASFSEQRQQQHVLGHRLVVVEQASAAIRSAVVLPQDARFVDQATENNRRRYRSEDSHDDPLNAQRE